MGYCQTLVNSAGSGSCDFADACCASASPDGDASQTGPLHGSIAFSRDADDSYAWGIAWSFDSSAGARAEALGQCRAHDGTRCSQAGWFREACGALAIGDDNGYGTGWGATAAAAKRNALAQCRASNNDCRIEVARCAQSEQAGGSGRTEREDTARRRPSNAVQPANDSKSICSRWRGQAGLNPHFSPGSWPARRCRVAPRRPSAASRASTVGCATLFGPLLAERTPGQRRRP